jgi:hypothetical protein
MRAAERDHSPAGQQHVFAGRRVPAATFFFYLDAELSKPADKNVFAVFELILHQFQHKLKDSGSPVLGKTKLLVDGIGYLRFGQCHAQAPEKRIAAVFPLNGANLLKLFGFVNESVSPARLAWLRVNPHPWPKVPLEHKL